MAKPDAIWALRQMKNLAGLYRATAQGDDYKPQEIIDLGKQDDMWIDRIAELIAADVEYDTAYANWLRWGRPGSGKAITAYKAAEKRRAAALAACRGM